MRKAHTPVTLEHASGTVDGAMDCMQTAKGF
jgi:hypothetical protein